MGRGWGGGKSAPKTRCIPDECVGLPFAAAVGQPVGGSAWSPVASAGILCKIVDNTTSTMSKKTGSTRLKRELDVQKHRAHEQHAPCSTRKGFAGGVPAKKTTKRRKTRSTKLKKQDGTHRACHPTQNNIATETHMIQFWQPSHT